MRVSGHCRWFVLVFVFYSCLAADAYALITGGVGNAAIRDPGWQAGVEAIFNNESRIAWWEGPPFGGGQYHGEFRGDTKTFNAVLRNFSKVKAETKRLIVNDGKGKSFWLDPNRRRDAGDQDTQMDWQVVVWIPRSWQQLSKLPADMNPTNKADKTPPAEIHLFVGGNVNWKDVVVPGGIQVIDNRMEAHGYTTDDGMVLEGVTTAIETGTALRSKIQLQEIKPKPTGGYDYITATEIESDKNGKWVIKNTPQGWFQIVVTSPGFVPRNVGYLRVEEQHGWKSYACKLAKSAEVNGLVANDEGEPLANARVRLSNVVDTNGNAYKASSDFTARTDEDGRFLIKNVPHGKATIRSYMEGHFFAPGLGKELQLPVQGKVELTMWLATELEVTVLFRGPNPPDAYIVELEPEGGAAVGLWSGSSLINKERKVVFKNVPPGKYVVGGHPNPTSADEKTPRYEIELIGGQKQEFTLRAKQ